MTQQPSIQEKPNQYYVGHFRFSVLTAQLVRIEYSETNQFEDHSTFAVINRFDSKVKVQVTKSADAFHLITNNLQVTLDLNASGKSGLEILVLGQDGSYVGTWKQTDDPDNQNLKGTIRTLDDIDGQTPIGPGLMSRRGYGLLDDSQSVILASNGEFRPRENAEWDIYFFGYGHDYVQALKDFYRLSGPTPLLPRFALGNWWSRYYPYSQEDYQNLFKHFAKARIPFSVAIMDMGWHQTKIPAQYGSGWTGYSWNRELFPKPEALLDWLHQQGLKVSLNVHPADGIRPYETMYPAVAKALNVPKGLPVRFDMTNPAFRKAYFELVHHPNEKLGVDFWWIDWQQGSHSSVNGLDPLWLLNYYHYHDIARNGHRPLILSRYAGIGSHRYPVGFSGDTHATWASLQFQPYFTATASNVGYGWWSHDIGGHMEGARDDELTMRWLQLGVFSPINRLHSSDNLFSGKEPWHYAQPYASIMSDFLRLRHQLVPYLYTMNVRAHEEGEPLIEPLYYRNPQNSAAYSYPNEYYFGTSMLVAPITTPLDQQSQNGSTAIFLPEGKWVDWFTGATYSGDQELKVQRPLAGMPVFVRQGAIVPLASQGKCLNETANPKNLDLRVFAGDAGQFTMVEDDDAITPKQFQTHFSLTWDKQPTLTIEATGNAEVVPAKRRYSITMINAPLQDVTVSIDGEPEAVSSTVKGKNLVVDLPEVSSTAKISVELSTTQLSPVDQAEEIYAYLDRAHIAFELKQKLFLKLKQPLTAPKKLQYLAAQNLPNSIRDGIEEILLRD